MFLAANIGNTNMNLALFGEGKWQSVCLLPIGDEKNLKHRITSTIEDECLASLRVAIIASVNPLAEDALIRVLSQNYRLPIFKAGSDLDIPIVNRTDFPEKVGVDRLLNALAAYRLKKSAAVVVDVGTAITVDAVSAQGEFLGGAIAPGLRLASSSLAEKASLLPLVKMSEPSSAIGRNTKEAIKSGVFWGMGHGGPRGCPRGTGIEGVGRRCFGHRHWRRCSSPCPAQQIYERNIPPSYSGRPALHPDRQRTSFAKPRRRT